MTAATDYELLAPRWRKPVPGQKGAGRLYRRGDIVTLTPAQAARLTKAGAVRPVGKTPAAPVTEPTPGPQVPGGDGSSQTQEPAGGDTAPPPAPPVPAAKAPGTATKGGRGQKAPATKATRPTA